jgi:predicted PurR-regulated permease PerM
MNWTRIVFLLLMFAVFIAAAIFYQPMLAYLLISVIFAYIFDPLITWLEFQKVPRWLSILILYSVIGGLLVWLTMSYFPILIRQGNALITLLTQSDKPLSQSILELPFVCSIVEFLQKLDGNIPQLGMEAKFSGLINSLTASLSKLPAVLFENYQAILSTIAVLLTIPIFSFFIMKDDRKLRQGMVSIVPNRYFELALILMNKVDEVVGRYLRAILLEMCAVSFMASLAMAIVGVPYAILIGIIAGITNVIPYFGPYIGGAIAALVVLITGHPPVMILWVAVAMFLVQQLDNYIVYPIVIGKTIKMHPLVVLITVLAGGYFGGVVWMLVSVPLVYMLYSLILALQKNLKQFRLL